MSSRRCERKLEIRNAVVENGVAPHEVLKRSVSECQPDSQKGHFAL